MARSRNPRTITIDPTDLWEFTKNQDDYNDIRMCITRHPELVSRLEYFYSLNNTIDNLQRLTEQTRNEMHIVYNQVMTPTFKTLTTTFIARKFHARRLNRARNRYNPLAPVVPPRRPESPLTSGYETPPENPPQSISPPGSRERPIDVDAVIPPLPRPPTPVPSSSISTQPTPSHTIPPCSFCHAAGHSRYFCPVYRALPYQDQLRVLREQRERDSIERREREWNNETSNETSRS